MNNTKRILSGLLACSLTFSVSSLTVHAKNADTLNKTSTQVLQRVNVSKNNTHPHYEFQDADGNTIYIDSSTPSSKKRGVLPETYSCIDEKNVTPIKNQGVSGCCWAFAALKSLESNCIRQNISSLKDTDFSENHLAWYTYQSEEDSSSPLYGDTYLLTRNPYDEGGDALTATATLANWWGAANEADAPFSAMDNGEIDAMTIAMTNSEKALRYKSEVQLNSAICYDYADQSTIKQALMTHGAIDVSLYSSMRYYYEEGNSIYQNKYNKALANHCVTIVGWDDNFNDFDPENSPSKPGAWLIANSYGTDVFNDGFVWLSYEDTSICDAYSFIAEKEKYDTNFQYDAIGYLGSITDGYNQKAANVFTNDKDTPQQIEAAGFYTIIPNQKYKIQVYRKLCGSTPDSGILVEDCTVSGVIENPGYYNITLNHPVAIDKNETFAIAITYYMNSNNTSYLPIEGTNSYGSQYYSLASKANQSFIYSTTDKCWEDTTNYSIPVNRFLTQKQNLNNLCIKALATTLTEDEYYKIQQDVINKTVVNTITADSNNYKIGKNETINLNLTTSPYVPLDYLTYTSSDNSIATISPDGTVTGNAKGTTSITVTSASGVTYTAKITVKNKPASVKAVLANKKIKAGQTTRVKAKLSSGSASYNITYKSLNKKIATVNKIGKVTAKKKGTAKIRVTTYNGKTSTVKLKVTK